MRFLEKARKRSRSFNILVIFLKITIFPSACKVFRISSKKLFFNSALDDLLFGNLIKLFLTQFNTKIAQKRF